MAKVLLHVPVYPAAVVGLGEAGVGDIVLAAHHGGRGGEGGAVFVERMKR